MTQKEKDKVVEILDFYGSMIGTDSVECLSLISTVKQLNCSDKNKSLDDEICNEANRICSLIGYVVNEENNKSQGNHMVPMRDAVAQRLSEQFFWYDRLPLVIAGFFGKDRSTGYASIVRAKKMLGIKDEMFMTHYRKTFNTEKEAP